MGYLGAHGDVFAEDLDGGLAIQDLATPGSLGLKAHEQDGVLRVGKAVAEMVEDAAAGGHPRGGNNHRRSGEGVDGFGFAPVVPMRRFVGKKGSSPRSRKRVSASCSESACR
jgi:hypothetical protein